MKKLFLLLFLLPLLSYSQNKKSCCAPSTTEKFGMMASTEKFASAHASPIPFNFVAEKGAMITFDCKDEKKGNAFEVKAAIPTDNWLIVFHEWWGLNDYIKKEAERLATEIGNVNVLAIDLYDGQIATNPEDAQKIMGGIKDERARAIIEGAFSHAGDNARFGTLGWCFGGGWSLQASIMAGKLGIACVMYYGMPETDHKKLTQLNADVLGLFAKQDDWITPAVVATFETNMADAGKKVTTHSYNAVHAFANPSNPKYNKEAAAAANAEALAFLKERFK